MMLGVIADDFTGASDVAAMLARGGMPTELLIGVPDTAASAAEAGVVALKTRSIAADEAVAQSLAALAWLRRQGCRQILFKYCSTFDSTPAGNIGPVGEALAGALGVKGVVVCPALPENGRTLYFGHLFVNGRLLSESGLEHHPLNPMTDPDIRRWLARQSTGAVGLLAHDIVRRGPEAIREALRRSPETLVVVDAIADADLVAIGRAVRDAPLITGGSGVALALPENFLGPDRQRPAIGAFRPASGPGAVLSGSCAPATRRQVESFAAGHPAMAVDIDAMLAGDAVEEALLAFVRANAGKAPLVYSSADPAKVAEAQQRHGREALAARLEALFGSLARRLVEDGVSRLVIAGGETSGAVVSALGTTAFAVGPEIAPGVPALSASSDSGLALALKSGNFGQDDFFERALAMLEGQDR